MVLEKTLESPLYCKEIQPVHPKGDQSWVFIGRTDAEAATPVLLATSCEELTHWKRPWCWEELGAGGEGGDRGWDGWMASLTWWTWFWVNSGSWWWAGKPDVLLFMGSQTVRHDWVTELNWRIKFQLKKDFLLLQDSSYFLFSFLLSVLSFFSLSSLPSLFFYLFIYFFKLTTESVTLCELGLLFRSPWHNNSPHSDPRLCLLCPCTHVACYSLNCSQGSASNPRVGWSCIQYAWKKMSLL